MTLRWPHKLTQQLTFLRMTPTATDLEPAGEPLERGPLPAALLAVLPEKLHQPVARGGARRSLRGGSSIDSGCFLGRFSGHFSGTKKGY